jgi:hypothetical protein
MCAVIMFSGTTLPFLIPEIASSSYQRESHCMGLVLRNKKAMLSSPNCRLAADCAHNNGTGVMHCSGGK